MPPGPSEEIEAAFTDLTAEILLILTRLLGREMALRLAADLADRAPALAAWPAARCSEMDECICSDIGA